MYANRDNVTYFENFGVEHIPREIEKLIGNKTIKTKTYRIQSNDSILSRKICIGLFDFTLKGKCLLHHTN